MIVLMIVLVLVILAELSVLCRICRHGHPDWPMLRQYLYAHRGYHDKPQIPENSMAAFRRAVENGFGAELDVHLLADGNLAVIHDSSLMRTAGTDVEVEDLTTEQLGQYRLEGTDEPIPLFSQVLELFRDKTPLIVEVKSAHGNHNELTAATVAMLDRYPDVRYCMESFDPRCIIWLRKNRPEINRGQLSCRFLPDPKADFKKTVRGFLLQNLFFNLSARPDFIAYDFNGRNCRAVKLCRRIFKVQEVNWTIRSRENMNVALALGNLVIFEKFDPRGEISCE